MHNPSAIFSFIGSFDVTSFSHFWNSPLWFALRVTEMSVLPELNRLPPPVSPPLPPAPSRLPGVKQQQQKITCVYSKDAHNFVMTVEHNLKLPVAQQK